MENELPKNIEWVNIRNNSLWPEFCCLMPSPVFNIAFKVSPYDLQMKTY